MPKFTLKNITATLVVVGFFIFANVILVHAATTPDIFVAYGLPMFIGAGSTMGFFYLFMHEDTFPFATVIERGQKKAEKRWLKYLPKSGKAATVVMMGVVGGPLLAAFSAQFFIRRFKDKYTILALTGVISGFLVVAAARGLFAGVITPLLHFLQA